MFSLTDIIVLSSTAIIVFYYLFFFIRVYFYKSPQSPYYDKPVSIIIAARNEEENLCKNLPLVLSQDYPEYEVIVVNDCSWDNTWEVLEAFAEKYDHLTITNLKETELFSGGKKYAVTLGIKAARYDYLLFIDADCHPASNQWIKQMVTGFTNDKEIVLGYGKYQASKHFLNKLIRYDAFSIAQQYLSFAIAKLPYMGVGRNMGYKKELFFRAKGFKNHIHIPSGDDDLFINETANARNTAVVLTPESFTISQPKESFKEWSFQKRRHLTTGKKYRLSHKILLGILPAAKYLFFFSSITGLIIYPSNYVIIECITTWLIIHLIVVKLNMIKLQEKGFWLLSPIMEMLLLSIYPIFTLSNVLHKPNKWMR